MSNSIPLTPTSSTSISPIPEETLETEFIQDSKFWLVFLSLCVASFLSALDLTAVSTVLPTIAQEFKSDQYSWVGSSYALTSTAFIPWTASLASIFGRKSTMLGCLLFFAVGSAVVGAAPSMSVVILGRSLQGVGGGGILTTTEIIVVDMIPLAKRGAYFGILGSVWALSSAIGPSIGGALTSHSQWRWLFWMNLPISAVAAVLVASFMNLKVPSTTFREKVALMDWANIVFVISSTSTILGLTWAGESYSWSSSAVLVPVILGLFGMVFFFYLEKSYVKNPTVPFDILRNSTSLLGYFSNMIHGIVVMIAVYYLPVYFQSVRNATPLEAGVDLFSLSFTIAPFAIITGIVITITSNYKFANLTCWAMIMIGFGLCTLLDLDSSKAAYTSFVVILGCGLGVGYAAINFPVLAPLETTQQPAAAAFLAFSRSFGQVLGITLGGTILNNQLAIHLPSDYSNSIGGANSAFANIPTIKYLPEPMQDLVKIAFATSLRRIYWCGLILAAVAFIASVFMKEIKMSTEVNKEWGVERKDSSSEVDIEKVL